MDKLLDVQHAINLSDRFYLGIISFPGLVPTLGAGQCAIAIAAVLSLYRQIVDPIITIINLGTLLSVRVSIVDPWGWYLEGTK